MVIYMKLFEIIFLAAALSMDAFSVALASGLNSKTVRHSDALKTALFFGFFQFFMPIVGSGCTLFFQSFAAEYSGPIVFFILSFLGVRMIIENAKDEEIPKNPFSIVSLLMLAFATSIDALAAGITLGASRAPVLASSLIIGITAFLFSYTGVFIGMKTSFFKLERAGIIGGIMLIILGIRALIPFIISFF